MNKNVLLVGAGELGSRHLQSLASLNVTYKLYVVEPSIISQELAKKRYAEVAKTTSPEVEFFSSTESLSCNEIDVAIIATGAAVRLSVIKNLLSCVEVKYLILEKVLFQSTQHLLQANNILVKSNIKSWVNCPRRLFVAYKELKNLLCKDECINFSVSGVNWGLACNAIHFVDLWAYLCDNSNCSLSVSKDAIVVDSKREGYKEIYGKISGVSFDEKHRIDLFCESSQEDTPFVDIEIQTNLRRVSIREDHGVVRCFNLRGELEKTIPLEVMYQSQMTSGVIMSLLDTDNCELTSFAESSVLHSALLEALIEPFKQESQVSEGVIPIT